MDILNPSLHSAASASQVLWSAADTPPPGISADRDAACWLYFVRTLVAPAHVRGARDQIHALDCILMKQALFSPMNLVTVHIPSFKVGGFCS